MGYSLEEGEASRKKRYSEQQIVCALKQTGLGETTAEICRKMGVSKPTLYNWKKRYQRMGVMGVAELHRLKAAETFERHNLQETITL